jgi:multiple sugar transport system substrate-binding protein
MAGTVLATVLVLALAGCVAPPAPAPAPAQPAAQPAAAQPAAAQPVKIAFWNGVGAPENVVLSRLIADYNAGNKDGVTVEESVLDWGTLYPKVVLDFKAGNPPDCLTMQQTNLAENASLGVLAPIDDLVAAQGFKKADFVAGPWDGTFVNGKQYAVPLDQHPLALYYNVKMVKDAGLDPAKPPTNKEEFLNWAQKLTGNGKYGIGWGYSGGVPFRIWMALLQQHKGEDVLSADNTKAAFNTPAGIESLQFVQDLIYKNKVMPEQEQNPDDDFMKGLIGMTVNGPWAMADYNKAADLDYMTAPLPTIFDQPATWANSHTLVLTDTKDKARQEACMKLIRYLSDQSFIWTRDAGHMPVRNSVLQSDDFKKLTKSQAFARSLEFARYYPSIIKQSAVFGREPTSPFVMMMESVMLNKATPKDAVPAAEKAVNDILSKQ